MLSVWVLFTGPSSGSMLTTPLPLDSRMKGIKQLSKSGKRRRGKQENADSWARWQLLATSTRIGIETLQPWLDHLFGPGRLL
jgi:hypothetical protein